MLLESDVDWKSAIIRRLVNLETTMGKMAEATSLNDIHDIVKHIAAPFPASEKHVESNPSPPNETNERAWEIDVDAAGGPAAIPASHITERSQGNINLPAEEGNGNHDLIKNGVITLERATELFNTYHNSFDHFLYRILGEDKSFNSVRLASPLLLSAICAVSALQTASSDFERCYQAFLKVCSARAFSKDCASEDVQAYCIGAFWLSDMSWNLVGAGEHKIDRRSWLAADT
jgi:hypothetical protein